MLDTAIIGGGPAALSAALYLARGGKKVEVFERSQIGGDLGQIADLENFPGYTGSGADLAKIMRQQAEAAGAKIGYGECQKIEDCVELQKERTGSVGDISKIPEHGFRLLIDDEVYYAKTVLIASGAEPRKLKVQTKIPVSYCALCDAAFAKGKRVAVIGGADSAVQESLYLAPMVKELTVITHSRIKARVELQNRIKRCNNVKILENMEPTSELLDKFEYVFVFIGKDPATGFLQGLQQRSVVKKDAKFFGLEIVRELELLDEKGYMVTGGKGKSAHETVVKGMYAAGDVCSGAVRQVVTAAGDGAAAGIEMLEYLNSNEL